METSCGVVLVNGQRVLLLHYPSGHWDFPKGHVEQGETERQTALRELEEETGITAVELHDGFRERTRYSFRRRAQRVRKQVFYFLATTTSEKVTLSHEHRDYAWVEWEAAAEWITYANGRRVLQRAREAMYA